LRSAVRDYVAPVAAHSDQELEQVALGRPDLLLEGHVGVEPIEPCRALPLEELGHAGAGLLDSTVPDVEPERAAVGAQLLDVDHVERVGREDPVHGQE
jgi:hypothetical protein